MKVETWPIKRVKPYPGNPRKNDATVEKVARSIREIGFQQPIVVDGKGVVVVGHARLAAAQSLRLKSVPVVVIRDRTPQQIRTYRLMDNRSHEETLWDEEALAKELAELTKDGVDPELTGFDEDELQRLTGEVTAAPALADPPPSVQQNVERLQTVKSQRARGNANVIAKSDTEHYLVVVFPNRAARESAVRRLGLPEDERYVDATAVEIRPRLGGARELRVRAERGTAAARPNKAGATG